MANWYVGSTNWTAVTAWAALTAYVVGDLRRQLAAPAVGSERVWRCTTAGTSGAAEPAWTLTADSTTADGTVVWTEVTGDNAYGWTAAHARLNNAFAAGWGAAGDVLFVSDSHAETQTTALTLASCGTAASPCRILCVDDSAAPPTTLATTATITTTGASDLLFTGYGYYYGITYTCGTSGSRFLGATSVAAGWWLRLEACTLAFGAGAGSGSVIEFGGISTGLDDSRVELINTRLGFTNVGHGVVILGTTVIWGDTPSAIAGTVPTTLFKTVSNFPRGLIECRNLDLSALGAATNLVDAANPGWTQYSFINCKLGSSVLIGVNAIVGQGGAVIRAVNCDSADTNYRYYLQNYSGTIIQDTAVLKTGGATDGTTPFSRKMVTTANSKFESPLCSDYVTIWNETLSARTLYIPIVTDNVTLTDAEAWIEVEYLGTSGFPLALRITDRAADVLATPVNQDTDAVSAWPAAPGTPVKQKLQVTFTPAEKGPIRARVCLAKASTTLYFDPKPVIS